MNNTKPVSYNKALITTRNKILAIVVTVYLSYLSIEQWSWSVLVTCDLCFVPASFYLVYEKPLFQQVFHSHNAYIY